MVTKKSAADKGVLSVDAAADAAPALDTVQDTLAEFLETASVDRVYGELVREGDVTVIPTAEVLVGMGFAVGFGGGQGPAEADAGQKSGEQTAGGHGGGGGGGGRTLSRPVAVVVVSPDGVLVEPVVDVTKIAIAAITAAGFMMATLLGILSPRRIAEQLKGE
jgi:uncharacterized spore protein YtfJ